MARRVFDAGITQIHSDVLGLDERKRLAETLERSDKIYASAAVFPELKRMAPDKVELYRRCSKRAAKIYCRKSSDHIKPHPACSSD